MTGPMKRKRGGQPAGAGANHGDAPPWRTRDNWVNRLGVKMIVASVEEAIKSGFFEREISPVTLPDGTVVSTDDGPRAGVTYEAISQLDPVFRPDGVVTAGNCCPLNDGAAAVVIMSDTKARELGITPLARIVSTGVTALSPEIMGLGPVEASKQALKRAGMTEDECGARVLRDAALVPLHLREVAPERRFDPDRPAVNEDRKVALAT